MSKPITSGYDSPFDGDWKRPNWKRKKDDAPKTDMSTLGGVLFPKSSDECEHPSWTKLRGLYGNERCDECGQIRNWDLPF